MGKLSEQKISDYIGSGFSFLILLQTTLLVLVYQFHWTLPWFVKWFPVVSVAVILGFVILIMILAAIIN